LLSKKKECSECGDITFLWKSNPPLCKLCAAKLKKTKIKPFSKKRSIQNKEYIILRRKFLDDNLICQLKLIGCTHNATDIEHREGRIGDLLTNVNKWLAVCRNCHIKIETTLNKEAYEQGIKIRKHESGMG
jgi:hypothetical protein